MCRYYNGVAGEYAAGFTERWIAIWQKSPSKPHSVPPQARLNPGWRVRCFQHQTKEQRSRLSATLLLQYLKMVSYLFSQLIVLSTCYNGRLFLSAQPLTATCISSFSEAVCKISQGKGWDLTGEKIIQLRENVTTFTHLQVVCASSTLFFKIRRCEAG